MRSRVRLAFAVVLLGALAAGPALAQGLTLPPSGDNQRAKIVQHIGPVKVSVDYSSPRVVLKGNDRRGRSGGSSSRTASPTSASTTARSARGAPGRT